MSFFTSSSMDKLGSRLASLVSSASEKVKEAAERTLTKETSLEKNLREAVSDKNWGCATSVLSEIARSSHNYADFVSISKTMWDAIAEPPKRWKRIFKGLTMLEYMLKNGSERFVEEARDRSYLLRMLSNFSWSEEGRDKGAGIREKAEVCNTLVFDAAELKAAREVAAKNRDKYIGISSASSMAYRSSSSNSSSKGSAAASSSFGSSTRHSAQKDSTSRSSRSDQGPQPVEPTPSGPGQKSKAKTSGKKEGKKSESASPPSTKSSADKSPAQQADLLGFDSPQVGPQATPADASPFASGNVWADFSSTNATSASGSNPPAFAPFVPPPPRAAGSVSIGMASSGGQAATATGGDDLFGGFQAATSPAATATGSNNSFDAVAAAFAATPQATTTAGSTTAAGALGTSPLSCLSGVQQNIAGTVPAGGGQPAVAPFAVGGGPPAAATTQNPQWQQPFIMGSSSSSSSSTMPPQPFTLGSSSSTVQQPIGLGSSSSSTQPQPFSLGSNNTQPHPFFLGSSSTPQQQPFSLSSSSTQQQRAFSLGSSNMQQQGQPVFLGSGAALQQPFAFGGGAPQQWGQHQQATPASATAFPPLDRSPF